MNKSLLCAVACTVLLMACSEKKEAPASSYVGPEQISLENGVLTPEILLSLGRLSDPQISPDGKTVLYGVAYQSVKDNRSCRNIYTCRTDGTDRVQLTREARSISCARWSNDGKAIYFLQGGQLYKASYKPGKLGRKTKLSDVPAGISEFKLSPDGSQILYISTIKNPFVNQPKDIAPELDKAQAYETSELMYRHWDHWVTEIPRTFVATLPSGTITPENSLDLIAGEPFELPTEPFGGCEQLCWHPDGRHIAYSCRKLYGKQYAFSTCTDIFIYDILTGQTVNITCGGGYDTDPSFSPDGKSLAWISMERDGYEADRQRIRICDIALQSSEDGQCFGLEASNIRELTVGFKYDAAGLFWTPDSRSLIFPSTMDALGALCRVDIATAQLQRITPKEEQCSFGTPFGYVAGDDGIKLYATVQSMSAPTELCSMSIGNDGAFAKEPMTRENESILSQLAPVRTEEIWLGDLHCWVLYPPQFDPEGINAGVEMFNGGPQTCIEQGWSYRWNFFMMAQQGYVVVLPNRHGDSGFGQEWKEQISGDYQGLNMEDYKIAARWFKSQKWAGKLAGVGASYGGFSVYNMMGMHGDLFDCFISHAGIFDEKMLWYTTEEAWFGNWDNGGLKEYAYEEGQVGPKGDGVTFGGMQQAGAPYACGAKVREHYDNDPEAKVAAWHTPLLCMHGMMDFRIPYTQGMAAFNAAQMMGVPSKLVIFPEENHWILQPQNALLWHREFFDWLEKWLR